MTGTAANAQCQGANMLEALLFRRCAVLETTIMLSKSGTRVLWHLSFGCWCWQAGASIQVLNIIVSTGIHRTQTGQSASIANWIGWANCGLHMDTKRRGRLLLEVLRPALHGSPAETQTLPVKVRPGGLMNIIEMSPKRRTVKSATPDYLIWMRETYTLTRRKKASCLCRHCL